MKPFLIKLFLFIGFVAIAYPCAIFIWGSIMPYYLNKNLDYRISGYMHTRLSEATKTKDIDILFLGSSHTYRGFDTRIFKEYGFTSFNLGSSSQTPIQTLNLLESHLKRLRPKVIIYEVYPEVFSIDGLESALDILPNDHLTFSALKMTLKINHLIAYNSFIFYSMRQCFEIEDTYEDPPSADQYISGGYVESELKYNRYQKIEDTLWPPKKSQVKAFIQSVDIIRRNKIPFIIVRAPITNSLYNSVKNNDEYNQLYSKQGEFYDFNKILSLDDSLHFRDADHLNQHGVILFNNKLIEILEHKQLLPKD